jgi:hypothetical protein
MIRFNVFLSVIFISLLFSPLAAEPVLAQFQDDESGQSGDNRGRSYGKGQPKSIRELPPGQLRKTLESLPAKAQGKALGWLQDVSFPAEDVKNLRANADGSIHYADTFLPAPVDAADVDVNIIADPDTAPAVSASEVFQLHSRPGSNNVVFLDFDGHTVIGTAWNSNGNTLVALPFDPSGNDSPPTVANFTQIELDRIAIIWHRMAEDFAAFDIDVTTEEPTVFTPTTGRVLFTHTSDASGQAMPSRNAGGVAFLNVFGWSSYATKYSPAFVYYPNLSGVATYNAEAGSHEFGHNIGLSHDGVSGGTGYYTGSGSGEVDWAPIMGNAYYAIVTPWSRGEYANANNTQDDLAILAGDLGYAGDDHGDKAADATPLLVESNGDILVSSPEFDPENILPENKGIIDDNSDVDWFSMDVADGTLNITATPAWHSFGYTAHRGANLDIELSLFDSSGNLVDFDEPTDRTNATVTASVTAGRYYVQVNGVGNNTNSDYSDYASIGMYFIEGTVQAGGGDGDVSAPSPATMSWQAAPSANNASSTSMTAVEATDDSGNVEYFFSCIAGGGGCIDSGWQSSRSHTAYGLDANTFYSYRVRARDAFGNENSASPIMGATTDTSGNPPAENYVPIAVATFTPTPAVITKGKTADVRLDSSGSIDPDGIIDTWEWQDSNGSTLSTSMTFTKRLKAGTHNFTLTVTDNDGGSSSIDLTVSVTKGGADDGDGGGGKKCNPRKQDCG